MDVAQHIEVKRLLIVDDHAIIRRGLRGLVAAHWPGIAVEEATTIPEIIPVLDRMACDVLLLDLLLNDTNTLAHIAIIHERFPKLKILVYSMNSERVYANQAISQGASGFLSKDTHERDLITAIVLVLSGGVYLSPEMESLLQQRREDRPGTRHEDPFNDLSDRELLVMGELLTGASVKEVAERLDLQPTTVATYKAGLFDKLAVTTLLELERLVTARNIHVGRK